MVEDFGVARLDLSSGGTVQVACSWNLPAGREAQIEATFYGTAGGVRMRNVNGSFDDFMGERFHGTSTEVSLAARASTPKPKGWCRLRPSSTGSTADEALLTAETNGGVGNEVTSRAPIV
jgi:hypothetical protein